MAEEVRRRIAALRLAALLAVALTVAGITTRQPVTRLDTSPVAGLPANSVGSRQVVDHSLQIGDIKLGEVLTPKRAAAIYVKYDLAEKTYLHKDEAAATYIKIDTPIDAYKLGGIPASGFVMGDGSVHTGLVQLAPQAVDTLLDVPGFVSVMASSGDAKQGSTVSLTNTSGEVLSFSWGSQSTVVQDGGTVGILIGLNQPTLVQVVAPTSGRVSSVTLNATSVDGTSVLFSAQALLGDG